MMRIEKIWIWWSNQEGKGDTFLGALFFKLEPEGVVGVTVDAVIESVSLLCKIIKIRI